MVGHVESPCRSSDECCWTHAGAAEAKPGDGSRSLSGEHLSFSSTTTSELTVLYLV